MPAHKNTAELVRMQAGAGVAAARLCFMAAGARVVSCGRRIIFSLPPIAPKTPLCPARGTMERLKGKI